MSISVNPPPQQNLPAKILDDQELRPFFLYQQEYLFKLWQRTGGGTDFIFESQEGIETIEAEIVIIKARLDAVEARVTYLEGLTIVTDIDLTIDNVVTGHQTIVCTAFVTIKLDATPADRDTAEIKQTDFEVIIDGNGKTIEGQQSLTLRRRNTKLKTGLVMRYSAADDVWYVI